MTSLKHTPGPLFAQQNESGNLYRVETAAGYITAEEIEREEDALLYAAAPDLLAAGKALEAWAEYMGGWDAPCWGKLRAAIAKATRE